MALVNIEKLTKKYDKTKVALNNVDLEINQGRIVGLLGSNGSGKTTLIKILAGILSKDEGEILIDGLPIGEQSKAIVSYLPDVSYINENHTIDRVIAFFVDFYNDFEEDRARKMFDNLGIDTQVKYKTLSKGTKEKVQLVMVMSRRAKLYLLDEPIAGVDPASRDYILNTIIQNYDENATIIITTHLITDIENILDDIIFINQSNVSLVSTVDEIREKHGKSVDEYFREVFKC